MKHHEVLPALLVALSLGLTAVTAQAVPIVVDPAPTPCISPSVHFTTIQAAVNAVTEGVVIQVCPATYPEQVEITKGLTLKGVTTLGEAVVASPPGGLIVPPGGNTATAPQIFVHDTAGPVNINGLTVDGSNNQITPCNLVIEGVYFRNASGSIKNVATRNQYVGTLGTCLFAGFGIRIVADFSVAFVTVQNNSVRSYDWSGISIESPLATASVLNNSIVGPGNLPTAPTGIFVLDGATGTFSGNSIIDNSGGNPGIYVFGAHGVTVSGNTLGNDSYGIYVQPDFNSHDADMATITKNNVSGSGGDGITVCSNNDLLQSNVVTATGFQYGGSAIVLQVFPGFCSANYTSVTKNTVNDAFCVGVWYDASETGNTITSNSIFNVPVPTGSGCPGSRAKSRPRAATTTPN
jgi:parallel beta helix pectate lyase-like protein